MLNAEDVRCGITPTQTKYGWDISTVQMKDYIQKKLNVAASATRQRLAANGKDGDAVEKIKDVEVLSLMSISPTKEFHTMLLILDIGAVQNKRYQNELSIFNPTNEGSSPRLKEFVYLVIKDYMFTKKDKELMNDPSYQKRLGGLKRRNANTLAANMSVKVVTNRKGGSSVVKVLIDPIKILWDMLAVKNTRERKVYITAIQKMNRYNYVYTARELFRDESKQKLIELNVSDEIADALQSSFNERPYN